MKKRWFFYLLIIGCMFFWVLWYQKLNKIYHVLIPVEIREANTPYTTIEIEGKIYRLELDLGSKFLISLRKNILDEIAGKTICGRGEWTDLKGNKYSAPSYFVKKISIAGFSFKDLNVQQEDDDYIYKTVLWDAKNREREFFIAEEVGTIGWPLLEKVNLLLDFSHSCVLASNDKKSLKKLGYYIDGWVKVPFKIDRPGIILEIETDFGVKKLAIDTGSTLNLIRNDQTIEGKMGMYKIPFINSSKFIINKNNFGSITFHLYELTSELNEIDGYLGMSFLENHQIYIDYPNRVAYIKN